MKPYDLMASKDGTSLVRILEIQKDRVLLIDCLNRSMPSYVEPAAMTRYRPATEALLYEKTGYNSSDKTAFIHWKSWRPFCEKKPWIDIR